MNITKDLIARIEERRKETKSPCKSYATEESAEKAAAKIADAGKAYFGTNSTPRYVVFFVPGWNRWTYAIDMTEFMLRNDFRGGYIGFFSQVDVFSF